MPAAPSPHHAHQPAIVACYAACAARRFHTALALTSWDRAAGRAVGLLGIAFKKAICAVPLDGPLENTYFWSTVYRWAARDCKLPDPGMYAVVGMASFLGGSGRITVMLACVIIELTDDASLVAPVAVASIISMIVGNYFNHGLYHGLAVSLSVGLKLFCAP